MEQIITIHTHTHTSEAAASDTWEVVYFTPDLGDWRVTADMATVLKGTVDVPASADGPNIL